MISDQPDVKLLKTPLKCQFPVARRPGLLFVLLVRKRKAKQRLLRLFVSKQTKDNMKKKPKTQSALASVGIPTLPW